MLAESQIATNYKHKSEKEMLVAISLIILMVPVFERITKLYP
jgi:hypothetical protein